MASVVLGAAAALTAFGAAFALGAALAAVFAAGLRVGVLRATGDGVLRPVAALGRLAALDAPAEVREPPERLVEVVEELRLTLVVARFGFRLAAIRKPVPCSGAREMRPVIVLCGIPFVEGSPRGFRQVLRLS